VKSDTVPAIENYSRWFSGRAQGSDPTTLIDFFPSDFLLIIDESHQTISADQGYVRRGSLSQRVLIAHGFRLPSALDNRPLVYDEFAN